MKTDKIRQIDAIDAKVIVNVDHNNLLFNGDSVEIFSESLFESKAITVKQDFLITDYRPATIQAARELFGGSVDPEVAEKKIRIAIQEPAKIRAQRAVIKPNEHEAYFFRLYPTTTKSPKILFSKTTYYILGNCGKLVVKQDGALWSWFGEKWSNNSSNMHYCPYKRETILFSITDSRHQVIVEEHLNGHIRITSIGANIRTKIRDI